MTRLEPGSRRRWLILAILCTSLLLAGIDLTVLQVAVPSLARALAPSGPALLWIVDVYSLTVAAFLIVCGTLADRIGRKRVVLAGFTVFGLSSLAAAFAASTGQLIAARAALGLGTALIMAATVAILRTVFPDDRERGFAIGLWTASHSAGTTLGPLIGGLLVEHFRWGSVFLVNVPIVAVVLVAGAIYLPESRNPVTHHGDPASVVLSVAGLGGFAYGLKQVASPDGPPPAALAIGGAGIALLAWFVHRQHRLAQPLLDLSLFRNRRFSVAVLAVFGCFGSYVAMLFLLLQWFQQTRGFSPLEAGAAVVPLAVANALGATLAPWLANRFGHRLTMTTALASSAVALGFFALGVVPAVVLVVTGFGAGIIMTSGADVITSAVRPERAGEAAAIQETSFELSAGIGVAALGSVLAVSYRLRLADAQATVTAAFDHGVRVSLGCAAFVLLAVSMATLILLRHPAGQWASAQQRRPDPDRTLATCTGPDRGAGVRAAPQDGSAGDGPFPPGPAGR